ncbi:NepR family anti-sigma factor [Microvirga makkahensis]
MSTNKPHTSTFLEQPDPLEEIFDVHGDPGPEPMLPPHVATFLGEQLQAFYAHLVSEPVPDRFVQLVQQLDGKKKSHDGE